MIATEEDQTAATPYCVCEEQEVVIRAVRPEDEPLLVQMYARNSNRTLRMRFFGLASSYSRDDVMRLCHLDEDGGVALAAVYGEEQSQPQIAGVSQYVVQPESGDGEFALVVTDAWQRHGLGRRLMQRLIAAARERGVRRLTGQVLIDNRPMLRLMKQLGFAMRVTIDPTVVEAELDLIGKPR